MTVLLFILSVLTFAVMNRARGSQFFGLMDTTLGRMAATYNMALVAVIPFIITSPEHLLEIFIPAWALLYLWTVPAWDVYWSAAMGHETTHSKLWGIGMMTLRQGLLLPYYIFLSYAIHDWAHLLYAASILLMGAVYWFWGWASPQGVAVRNSELTNGAIMGLTTAQILFW